MGDKNNSVRFTESEPGGSKIPFVQQLREQLRPKQGNPGDGDVIRFRWTPEGTRKVYVYAAVFGGLQWYLTGINTNSEFGYRVFTHQHFIEKVLMSPNVFGVEYASAWESVRN